MWGVLCQQQLLWYLIGDHECTAHQTDLYWCTNVILTNETSELSKINQIHRYYIHPKIMDVNISAPVLSPTGNQGATEGPLRGHWGATEGPMGSPATWAAGVTRSVDWSSSSFKHDDVAGLGRNNLWEREPYDLCLQRRPVVIAGDRDRGCEENAGLNDDDDQRWRRPAMTEDGWWPPISDNAVGKITASVH